MGACLILESVALLTFCERLGFGPLGITGISMGGHVSLVKYLSLRNLWMQNASLAGVSWPKPLSIVPCLSWTTASPCFTEGVMSRAIHWSVLKDEYHSMREEFVELMEMTQDDGLLSPSMAIHWSKLPPTEAAETMETVRLMKLVMDECTHLGHFSPPVDPELAVIVSASQDGYMPRTGFAPLTDIWRGAEERVLASGHISAILLHLQDFRKAIIDSFQLNARKYHQADLLSY